MPRLKQRERARGAGLSCFFFLIIAGKPSVDEVREVAVTTRTKDPLRGFRLWMGGERHLSHMVSERSRFGAAGRAITSVLGHFNFVGHQENTVDVYFLLLYPAYHVFTFLDSRHGQNRFFSYEKVEITSPHGF